MPSRRFLAALGLVVVSVAACTPTDEREEAAPDALRADPNATVPTDDPAVRLLSGYNAFLDRSTTMPCAVASSAAAPQVGDLRSSFYMRHVKTREDLAKELDVDVGASLKVPQASLDVATKVVKTFKQSSTTVTFLVRAVRSYVVANRADVAMSPEARQLLGSGKTNDFLSKCGGSFAKSVRYEAQVIGLMQFEATTEETARSIQTSIGGGTPAILQQLGSASADLKTRAEQTAAKYNASLSLNVQTSGFHSRTRAGGDVVEQGFEKIDELRTEMHSSVDGDIAKDREGYAQNIGRNARPSAVTQGTYAQLENAPRADYTKLTATIGRAEEFVRRIARVQLRLQNAYEDEVNRFLVDTQNQHRYNIPTKPKLRTQELVPIAEEFAGKFRTDRGVLVEPLRDAIERCVAAAGNGDYRSCELDESLDADLIRGETELEIYGRDARIVPMNAWMPRLDVKVSYYNAENECLTVSMRLPRRNEMPLIAPTVTALADPEGEVWFAEDAQCAKPYYANGAGQGEFGCETGSSEVLPYVKDRHVVCVGRSGPAPAMPPP